MTGTDMNSVVAWFQDSVQTKQSSMLTGVVSSTASTGNTGADFEEVMKVSTSNTEEVENARIVEKGNTSEMDTVCETPVKQLENGKQSTPDEKIETHTSEAEGKSDLDGLEMEVKELFVGEANNIVLPQKLQELFAKTDTNANSMEMLSEDLKKALEEIEEQIMQKIMENFNVTEDELKEAMEILAINIVDLLQTDNLKKLAICVSGEESLVSLVTNAEMYHSYKEVLTGIEEISDTLMNEFSITPEELQEMLSQVREVSMEATQDVMENEKVELFSEETPAEGVEPFEMENVKSEIQPRVVVEFSEVSEISEEQNSEEMLGMQEKGEVQIKSVTPQEAGTQKQNEFTSTENGEEADTTKKDNESSAIQTNASYSTVVTENEVQTVVKTQRTDFDGIVRQIVERIKVEIKPDVSSMELQLNPENLGKVNLQVTSKEGAVTAQLFVQNETVKTMIESQLMVLREAMNEQGVKVEAVEVTVETGQFGRNLEQHSEQQKQEAEKQAKSYQHKGINLLAGVEEETMNPEEMLRAHIMRESGNSVDMNA